MKVMRRLIGGVLVLCLLAGGNPAPRASSVIALTTGQHLQLAEAVFRGTVVSVESYRDSDDGLIYTRTLVRVDELFKGNLPAIVQLVHRGGSVGNVGERDGFAPQFKAGEERLLFISRRENGTLFATQGGPSAVKLQRVNAGRSVSDQLSPQFVPSQEALLQEIRRLTNRSVQPGVAPSAQTAARTDGPPPPSVGPADPLLTDGNGLPARYILPDRGEPIPYLVDADALPVGITLTQALSAVQTALAAWSAVSSVKYQFEGVQSFGAGADTIDADDGKLRVQLHDNYNRIPGATTLGIGGRYSSLGTLLPAGWGEGGNVAGAEFNLTTGGYVVLKHTNVTMQTLSTFTEVLCHETGHSLSLDHSSEDTAETNPLLKQAMMYFQAHADGRGATLGAYDPPIIQMVQPLTNTPPYTFPRVMDIVTATPTQPNIPGINEIELRGYDLQSSNLTLAVTNATTNIFFLTNNILKYTPSEFSSGPRLDPSDIFDYGRIFTRFSDGTNASTYVSVRVMSFSRDNFPATSDGIPDNWMTNYFGVGNANPAVGMKHAAGDDADVDGMTNLQEYRAGTDPTNASSKLAITSFSLTNLQWQARPYELYEVQVSTNLTDWTRILNPILPTSANGTATGLNTNGIRQFFRIQKVP